MMGMQCCQMSSSSTLEGGGGHIRASCRSGKMKSWIWDSEQNLSCPCANFCGPHTCEANYATAQATDDEHYEFNWCLRSPLGGRLLMHIGIHENYDLLQTRGEEGDGRSCTNKLPIKKHETRVCDFRTIHIARHPGTIHFKPTNARLDLCNTFPV